MMPKVEFNKDYKNHRVTIFENDMLNTYKVVDIYADTLEHEAGVLPLSKGVKYFDADRGSVHFFYNVDLPEKVEMQNLKLLRRSSAIKNLFSYDKNKKFDFMAFMPWLIIILLVLFK